MHSLQLPQSHPANPPSPNQATSQSSCSPKTLQFLRLPLQSLSHKPITCALQQPSHPNNNNNNNNNNNSLHHSTKKTHSEQWNFKIKHQLNNGCYTEAISLYNQMLEHHITPNSSTFVLVLKACSATTDLKTARFLHNDIIRQNLSSSNFLAAALLDAYAKCGRLDLSLQVFDQMPQPDIVSWNTIIRQNSQSGQFKSAIQIFRQMIAAGITPDRVSLVTILPSIGNSGHLKLGLEIHGYSIRKGFEFNKFLISSLLNMYAKLGDRKSAGRIFNSVSCCDNVAGWTVMITSKARSRDAAGAMAMFEKMVNSGVEPTGETMSSILRAVSQLGSLQLGTHIHGYIIRREFALDEFLVCSLIEMYAKCGAPSNYYQQLFDKMPMRDVVSWTTMIAAHGRRGDATAALRTFKDMRAAGIQPDSVTFTSILNACSHSSMLEEGLRCYHSMVREFRMRPREEHYACLVDLIARDGRLEEAHLLIESMGFEDDGGVWEAFLCACRVHVNVGLGEVAAKKLMEIEPHNNSSYILLSYIYCAVGRWEEADNLRKNVKKTENLERE